MPAFPQRQSLFSYVILEPCPGACDGIGLLTLNLAEVSVSLGWAGEEVAGWGSMQAALGLA